VQHRRNKRAAKKFFRKLLKGLTYVPRVIVTDKLKSYRAAKREILPIWNIASIAISIIVRKCDSLIRNRTPLVFGGLALGP